MLKLGSAFEQLLKNLIKSEEVVLYNNETGTTGNITLSETSDNFAYLEIFFRTNDNYFGSMKIYSPNNKTVLLNSALIYSTTTLIYKQLKALISGVTITVSEIKECDVISSAVTIYTGNFMYITRVVGYK